MNRREFNTSILTGAAALACGTIAAGGDVEAREEERGLGLKAGDRLMYVGDTGFADGQWRLGIGDMGTFTPMSNFAKCVQFDCHPNGLILGFREFQRDLVRVLPGRLEVGDRVICVSNNSNWRGTPPAIGQKGTVEAKFLGAVRKAVHFDEDPPGNIWLIPDNPPDLVKIQELS